MSDSTMRYSDLFSAAFQSLRSNVSRSMLTMLGIVIGVGAVVLMTSVGKSMEGLILGQISTLGEKSMVIFPGAGPEQGAGDARVGFDSLTFNDIDALKSLSSIESVSPIVTVPGDVTYQSEQSAPQILGVAPQYFGNVDITVAEGRLIEDFDETSAAFVAVLAPDVRADLFGQQYPLNTRIKIAGRTFTVVGISNPVGSQFFQNADERVFIPLSTARSITGQRYASFVMMKAVDSFDIAFADVRSLLRQRHDIDNPENDPDKDDFIVRSSQQANDILSGVSLGLTAFITAVAAISLIVGGIGIMNIMLVSVSQRTREIGLRKAIGATKRDVLMQFLIEAILLTCIGGLIGILGGLSLAWILSRIVIGFLDTYTFAVSFSSLIIAFSVAAATGLLFGIYPAKKAANLKPITALRYE